MFKFLRQPYPANESPLIELRKAALIGLFIGLFLVIFQPFGLQAWKTDHKLLKTAGFGLITFLVTAFDSLVWQRILPKKFTEENWTVGREILMTSLTVLLIAIANRLYLGWLLGPLDAAIGWGGMIAGTFLIALFPVTGLVTLNYIRRLKKYETTAATLPVHPIAETSANVLSPTVQVTLLADNEKDSLTIPTTDLLLIESSDNYCTVVHQQNGRVSKPLLRSSLARLEKQLPQPPFVRCHRSYVVNLDRVERVTGNAQGYRLHLLNGQFQIPVARQYNDTLVAGLKAN